MHNNYICTGPTKSVYCNPDYNLYIDYFLFVLCIFVCAIIICLDTV